MPIASLCMDAEYSTKSNKMGTMYGSQSRKNEEIYPGSIF